MELLVRSYHFTYWTEVPAIGLTRCANVFGVGDTNLRRVIPLFVSSAKKDRRIPLKYRKNGRQFIYVTDAVAGYIRAMTLLSEGGSRSKVSAKRPDDRTPFTQTFHFSIEEYEGTKHPYIEMEAVASLVAELFDAVIDDSGSVEYAANENRIQALHCAATRRALAWRAETSFRQGIENLGRYYDASGEESPMEKMMRAEIEALVSSLTATVEERQPHSGPKRARKTVHPAG